MSQPTQQAPACYRHPDRTTQISCVRCGRPICPDCMRPASVGFQCPECVAEGQASVRRPARGTAARVRAKRIGPVTLGLIAANVLAFLITVATAGSVMANYDSPIFYDLATVPFFVAEGEWWRLLSGAFLHYGLTHLAVNMLSLFILGRDLEGYLGAGRFAAIYGLSALGGSVALLFFANPGSFAAGASGAIFGLFGAIGVAIYQRRMPLQSLLAMLAINIAISFLPGISLTAHLGGLVTGVVAGAIVLYGPRLGQHRRSSAIVWVGLGLLAVLLVILSVLGASLI